MRISEVTEQLRVIGLTLARKLPRREREEFERMKRALIEARRPRGEDAPLGVPLARRGIRVYDATKTLVSGVARLSAGTVELTVRASAEGLDFTEHLPEARGEPSRSRAERQRREERGPRARPTRARRSRRSGCGARRRGGARRRRIEEAQRLERERAAEEISLYKKGAEARVRGSRRGLDADKFEAEELWRRLMKLRLERHGETDFTAVAISNVAVLMSEYAGDSDIKRADARLLSGRAIDVMRKHVAREIAADRAAQAGANEQYEADMAAWRVEMVEFETREREAREEARKKERELLESIRQAQELAGGEDNMEDDEKEQQLLSYEALAELEANRERTLTPPPEPTKPSVGAERHDEMHLLLGILIANRVHVFEDARAQKFVDLRKEMVSSLGAHELG